MSNDNEGAQANNTPLPPERAAPVSFKRLLGSRPSELVCVEAQWRNWRSAVSRQRLTSRAVAFVITMVPRPELGYSRIMA